MVPILSVKFCPADRFVESNKRLRGLKMEEEEPVYPRSPADYTDTEDESLTSSALSING